ncbi:sodium-dependent multivitamin transporter-like isoform X1 [Octopus sinensis]|uniref:Sodium-dependent multivitamin transporter-like isoform X1 n=2 Tax=Octopus sinensis TaxID=2607531 RepID=A0A6P7TFK0_9MOLL|nr:sodium-dependent multivitamin transporter-like isoform X1 [Octopus sinensis]
MESASTLTTLDYSIFSAIVIISLGIGVYFSYKGQKTTSEFIVASRQMKVLPLAISLMVSFESSIMMLGMPAEIYTHGLSYAISMIGFSLSQLISAFIYAPFFHRLQITSVFEYLELRFQSKSVRNVGTLLGILSYLCYLGIVLYGPSIALEAVTQFPMWCSIIIVALSSAIYTSLGGMKAVVWTDVFQSAIMYSGMVAVFIKGCMVLGGFGRIWNIAKEHNRLYFDTGFDPYTRHTVINLLSSSTLKGFGLVFNQSSIQRISSTQTESDARKILWITAPIFCLTTMFAILLGVIAFSFFQTIGCDPLESKIITNPNQVMPLFVLKLFQNMSGVTGLFIASVLSASLSTLSSGLSSLSTITLIDFVKPNIKHLSDRTATIVAKSAVFAYGLISIGLAFMVSYVGGSLTQIAGILITVFSAPLTGLQFYATLFPWAKSRGTLIGATLSTIITLWMAAGASFSPTRLITPFLPPASIDKCFLPNTTFVSVQNETELFITTEKTILSTNPQEIHGLDKFYSLSYTLIGVIGIVTVIIIGTIIDFPSYNSSETDYRYVVPVFRNICSCLPKSLQASLGITSNLETPMEKAKNKNYPTMEIKVVKESKDVHMYVMEDSQTHVSNSTSDGAENSLTTQH